MSLSFSLEGKVAVVTGSSRGIGRAVAVGLAEFGADVVVTSTPAGLEVGKAVAEEIERLGRRSLACPLEVCDRASIDRMVDTVISAYGKIDILVNNAGLNIPKPSLEVSEADWDAVLDTNLKGLFFCCQAVGRQMVERRSGKIVNMSSQAGVVGIERRAAYCASKGAVIQLTKVLAIEWAPYNVNVNAVGPTFVETDLTRPMLQDEEFAAEVLRRIPLKRVGQPVDVVGAVVYLASPAADLVTGHTLLVDGGWTAW